LKTALGDDAPESGASAERSQSPALVVVDSPKPASPDEVVSESEIVTTEEELEGFNIVRAIAVSEVAPERIVYRDAKVYMAILLDDNNRKPIIRLHLNGKSVKFVTTFEQGKDGIRRDVESVIDIYKVAAEPIRQAIRQYESGGILLSGSQGEGPKHER
jgi:predicted type IV restriction endonuclease